MRYPVAVKELIYEKVEQAKDARRMRATELLDGENGGLDGGEEQSCGEDW